MKKLLGLALAGLSFTLVQGVSYADCIALMPNGRGLMPEIDNIAVTSLPEYVLPDGYFKLQNLDVNIENLNSSDAWIVIGTGSCSDNHNKNHFMIKLESQINTYMELLYQYFQNNNIVTDQQKKRTLQSISKAICEVYGGCEEQSIDFYNFGDNLTWDQTIDQNMNYNQNISLYRHKVMGLMMAVELYKTQIEDKDMRQKNRHSTYILSKNAISIVRANDTITLTVPADKVPRNTSLIRLYYVSSTEPGVNIAEAEIWEVKMQKISPQVENGNYVFTISGVEPSHYYELAFDGADAEGNDTIVSENLYVGL